MTEPTLPPEPARDATADELEADIAATRAQLGQTIDALEEKLDLSAQAKRKVDQTKTELADKLNTNKAQLTNKVDAVRTQIIDKVSQTRAQVTDKVAQTKAKVSRKSEHPTTDEHPTTESMSDPGYVVDTVYPAEARVADSGVGSTPGTSTDRASRTQAVTYQVKNVSTRLSAKVAEVRTRTNAPGSNNNASAKRARVADSPDLTPTEAADSNTSTGSTKAAFASTAAAVTGRAGQAKAHLTGRASQFTSRTPQNPRSALPVVATVSAGLVVVWLARRVIRRPEPALERG